MTHELKCLEEYFQACWDSNKRFEIRLNDRDYKVGDWVVLKEYSPKSGYTGREIEARISYVTDFEQKPGWVVFGWRARSFTEHRDD
jgi:ASC-1-like (ASCH) protein